MEAKSLAEIAIVVAVTTIMAIKAWLEIYPCPRGIQSILIHHTSRHK
jgi:hypothetical protein